jgi:hypothetical protein
VIAAKLVELIESHAGPFTSDVVQDLLTNDRTRGFRSIRPQELEERIFQIVHHLGNWIGDPRAVMVQAEFADWGRRRFEQDIPLSEVMYAVIVLKQHLRRYVLDHGLVDAAFPRAYGDYILPLHLNSVLELNARLSLFFDEALYHLARGHEDEAKRVTVGAALRPAQAGRAAQR